MTKISLIFSYFALKKFKNRLDPRKYNGALFLGLNGPVVKSHGGTDAIGFYHSIDLCYKIVKGNLIDQIRNNLNNLNNESNNITKNDFLKNISDKTGFPIWLSKKIVDDLFIIFKEMIKNNDLVLKNIGTFKLSKKNERICRNPKTKEEF